MARPFEHKLRRGMEKAKHYKDYLTEYEKKLAPLRKARHKQALEHLRSLAIHKNVPNLINPWIKR